MASAQNDPAGIFSAEISAHMSRGTGGIEGTVTGGAGLERPPPSPITSPGCPRNPF